MTISGGCFAGLDTVTRLSQKSVTSEMTCYVFSHLNRNKSGLVQPSYIGEGDYAYMQFNETTNEIDLYVGYWDDEHTPPELLIYSYGDHPHCYVEGCEILVSP